jgi:hypothetical protein
VDHNEPEGNMKSELTEPQTEAYEKQDWGARHNSQLMEAIAALSEKLRRARREALAKDQTGGLHIVVRGAGMY